MAAAWRELWPVAALAMGIALATLPSNFGQRPTESSLILLMIPASLYAGAACGRGTVRTFAFLFARPYLRERMLGARVICASGPLVLGWAVITSGIVTREHLGSAWLAMLLLLASMMVAFASALVGATATEREPLALGIGALLCCVTPLGLLLPAETLGITLTRVLRAQPIAMLATTVFASGGFVVAVAHGWKHRLPLRDASFVKHILAACAFVWVPVQFVFFGLAWSAASAANAEPMALVGVDAQGPIVAAGNAPGFGGSEPVVDTLRVGPHTLLDLTHRRALLEGSATGSVTRVVREGGTLAATISRLDDDGREQCRLVLLDSAGEQRELGSQCGTLSLSPTGTTLAVQLHDGLELLDTATGQRRGFMPVDPNRRVVGWTGEELVSHQLHGDGEIRRGSATIARSTVAQARVSPDGRALAVVISGGPSLLPDEDAVLGKLDLARGTWVRHTFPASEIRIAGWLDDVHIALGVQDRGIGPEHLRVLVAQTALEVASVQLDANLAVEHIDGPVQGPWLLTRGGVMVDAWSPERGLLWREYTRRLERDGRDVRRWVLTDSHAMGVGIDGEIWERALPWEAQR